MSLFLIGVNHRHCPIEFRERLAAMGHCAPREILSAEGWGEVVVLSTCNRTEFYCAGAPEGSSPMAELASFLDRFAGGPASRHAYALTGPEAAGHLFSVACGLDSMILGETEILSQVKKAYEAAKIAGTTGKIMNVLFQRSLFVGKTVRSRTAISFGQTSMAAVAVELAKRVFADLGRSEALILGAGAMAEKTARHLRATGIGGLHVANRTFERALGLSAALGAGAAAARWEDFPRLLERVDVVVGSTGAPEPVLTAAMVKAALRERDGRSLFLIDIAMPRDIEDAASRLDGVYLYTMDDLGAVVSENVMRRGGEIEGIRAVLRGERESFGFWLASLGSGRELSLKHSPLRGAVAELADRVPAR